MSKSYKLGSNHYDNPDIEEYYRYGDLTFIYMYKKHLLELTLRNNLEITKNNRGSAEVNWTFHLPRFSWLASNIFCLWNSLIDYNREVNKVGLGLVFSR